MQYTRGGGRSLTTTEKEHDRKYLAGLSLGALGVVYGDIGTSPLYALRECFHSHHGLPASAENILGILSLVFWSLTIIISVKYLVQCVINIAI